MKEKSIDKMQKTAVTLNKMLSIANVIVFIAIAVLYVTFIFWGISIYTGNVWPLAGQITANGITLPIDIKLMLAEKMTPAFMVILVFIFIATVCTLKIISMLKNILESVAEARPFDGTVSLNLTRLGKTILALGILYPITEFIIEKIIFAVYQPLLEQISLATDGFNILAPEITIDLTVLFFGMFVILLGYIFRYGEELQQLSDETL